VIDHPYRDDYCTVDDAIEANTHVCLCENVPEGAFGKALTRFKYGYLDTASNSNPGSSIDFWAESTRLFGFFGVSITKSSSLYLEDSLADFYIEMYNYGLTNDGINSNGLVVTETSMINAYTVSLKTDLFGFEDQVAISNFWAEDSDGGATVDGSRFPSIIRMWGKLTADEASDKIAVFFDYMLPFEGVESGKACNITS